MNVLVTGASGFVGSTLVLALKSIAGGFDRREWLAPLRSVRVLELDRDNADELNALAAQADCVVHLAGINRSAHEDELEAGNVALAAQLVDALEAAGRCVPLVFSSSVQAALEGRFANSPYGKGKRAAEQILCSYGARCAAPVKVYRLPGVFGKWCRPYYNSVVATFCHQVAHGESLTVHDPAVELALVHVDDVIDAWLHDLVEFSSRAEGQSSAQIPLRGEVAPVFSITVGELAQLIISFGAKRASVEAPDCQPGSLEVKLRATYESYLPPASWSYPLERSDDERGSFAEFLRTPAHGQVSVNVCKPGFTKGNHWHHHKWERFLVVSGEALIRLRPVPRPGVASDEVVEFAVRGSDLQVVEMPPGYTHSITNTSATENLVFVIWSNEVFDSCCPDTFALEV